MCLLALYCIIAYKILFHTKSIYVTTGKILGKFRCITTPGEYVSKYNKLCFFYELASNLKYKVLYASLLILLVAYIISFERLRISTINLKHNGFLFISLVYLSINFPQIKFQFLENNKFLFL